MMGMEKTAFDIGFIDGIEKVALSSDLLQRAQDAAMKRVKDFSRAYNAEEDSRFAKHREYARPVGVNDDHVRSIFSRSKDRSMGNPGYSDHFELMNRGAERARNFRAAKNNAVTREISKLVAKRALKAR
jgi:hypothetical protein